MSWTESDELDPTALEFGRAEVLEEQLDDVGWEKFGVDPCGIRHWREFHEAKDKHRKRLDALNKLTKEELDLILEAYNVHHD